MNGGLILTRSFTSPMKKMIGALKKRIRTKKKHDKWECVMLQGSLVQPFIVYTIRKAMSMDKRLLRAENAGGRLLNRNGMLIEISEAKENIKLGDIIEIPPRAERKGFRGFAKEKYEAYAVLQGESYREAFNWADIVKEGTIYDARGTKKSK